MPLCMPSLLPHDLCHGRSSSRWPPAEGHIKRGRADLKGDQSPALGDQVPCVNDIWGGKEGSRTPLSDRGHSFNTLQQIPNPEGEDKETNP